MDLQPISEANAKGGPKSLIDYTAQEHVYDDVIGFGG